MRATVLLFALVLAGCQEVSPDPSPDPSERAAPSATATPASEETPDAPLAEAAEEDAVTLLFFGDSLTAGYGLSDPNLAYPALVGAQVEAAGVPVRVVNAGISGDTSAGGLGRIAWTLRQTTPDVFVLALGGNDGLRGTDPAATQENLSGILEAVREAAPDARLVVTGMEALPNYGQAYVEQFRAVFPAVAAAHDATLVPFLLVNVAGIDSLNQPDGIHPTAQGQRLIAETVAEVVVPAAQAVAG